MGIRYPLPQNESERHPSRRTAWLFPLSVLWIDDFSECAAIRKAPPTVGRTAHPSLDFSNAADIYSVNEAVSGCFQHAKAATRAYGGIFICLAQCESGGYVFPAMRVGEGMCR